MKVIFFGSDHFAIPSLATLCASKHKVLAVVTQPDRPAGRGQVISPCPVAMVAKEKNLKLLQPEKIEISEEEILKLRPDILAVVAYGQFIPQNLIERATHRAVNVHPSLLPKYRGAAPMQWAILNGDKETGVTTMTITQEMDAGDIYLQTKTKIGEMENYVELEERLSRLGADLLIQTLDEIEAGTLKSKPQDSAKVVFAPKIKKEDGHISWEEPAQKLFNKIRAYIPWPGAFCNLHEKRLKILRARPADHKNKESAGSIISLEEGITVACGQGALCLLEIQLEGKKAMSAKEFLKGHPLALGEKLK